MKRLVSLLLCASLAGCGAPFYVTTEPRGADLYVDGRFVGSGAAVVETNGIVFNSYQVEARDKQGNTIDRAEVSVQFGPRAAVFAGVGLFGILFWPLLPLLPASIFVGDPSPEHVHLHVPEEPPPPPSPPADAIDRPVLDVQAPRQGEEVAATFSVKVRARHWSGVAVARIELDGALVREVRPADAEVELKLETPVSVASSGHHVLSVIVKPVRGAEAREDVRITRVVPGAPPPPAPPSVPGLDDPGK